MPWILRVCSTSLLKTQWEKEKLLVTSNFSFSHSVFYLFEELSAIFNKLKSVQQIKKCRLQILSAWKSLKFFVWERVNLRNTEPEFRRYAVRMTFCTEKSMVRMLGKFI